MSFVKAADVLRLAFDLQGSAEGLSLNDIRAAFDVSRRTAERMRDAVDLATRQLEEVPRTGREKRWRLPPGVLGRIADASAADIADLARGAKLARALGPPGLAESLDALHRKLKALQRADIRLRNEADIEALLEADAYVSRPGPRPKIDPGILAVLRGAVLACRKVRITYRYRSTGKRGWDIVSPYGFLAGQRHYLVALREEADDFRTYALGNFVKAELLDASFQRRPDFSLAVYSARSFGVFQEKPFHVRWRFKPEAAPDVREYVFHPDQRIADQTDGTVVVTFRAGGLKEMAWHLLTWGDLVEVESPPELRKFWRTKTFAAAKRRLRPNSPLSRS